MTIVNFSTKEYLAGQRRLGQSLWGTNTKELFFSSYEEIGSPTHQQSPYAFKIHSFEKAFEIDDIVLWLDASLYRVGDITKIERLIQEDGYYMEESGHYCKDWCNQDAKRYFNLDPVNEAHFIMFSAGYMGLNKQSPVAMEFFRQWKASGEAGCFRGSWVDHRHEMVSGSIIAQRMGFKYQRGGSHVAYIGKGYSKPEPGVVLYCQGIL